MLVVSAGDRVARSCQLPSGLDYYEGSASKLMSEERVCSRQLPSGLDYQSDSASKLSSERGVFYSRQLPSDLDCYKDSASR